MDLGCWRAIMIRHGTIPHQHYLGNMNQIHGKEELGEKFRAGLCGIKVSPVIEPITEKTMSRWRTSLNSLVDTVPSGAAI